jgi:ABC-type enterochelin transport system permease subunit
MPLREKITKIRSAVPRGKPRVGLEECAIGIVMDGAGVRSPSLYICISWLLLIWLRAQTCKVRRLGIYTCSQGTLHGQRMMRSGLACTARKTEPSVVLASAVAHMHLLVPAGSA